MTQETQNTGEFHVIHDGGDARVVRREVTFWSHDRSLAALRVHGGLAVSRPCHYVGPARPPSRAETDQTAAVRGAQLNRMRHTGEVRGK